jgi:iron complex outermembrane receptor protein
MFKRLLCFGLIWFFLVEANNLPAADSGEQDAFDLGDIVVTSEKMDVGDIGISQVLTQEEIKATNSKTVADALQFTPGIMVTRGRKNEPEISVHGFSQEKSLFLIDGVPYYETYYGKLSLDQIPAQIISRIEITKNAPSVLYGPNAQIAVINVITKKGTDTPTYNVGVEIGEDSTYRALFSHGNQIGAVNYWFSYIHEESDGWRLSDDFKPETAVRARKFMPNVDGIHEDGGLRKNSDYEKNRLWARAGITPSPGSEYFVSMHLLDSEIGHPPATNEYRIFPREGDVPAFSTFSRFDDYDDWGIDLSGKKTLSDALTFRGKLFYHDHEDAYVSYDGPDYKNKIAKSTYKDDVIGISLFSDFILAEPHDGHVSLHYRRDSHEATDDVYLPYNQYQSYTGSLGTEHAYVIGEALTVYAGIAYDWFKVDEAEDYEFDEDDNFQGQKGLETSSTEDEINPMVGFSWNMDLAKLYGSVARKSQFPSLSQLFSSTSGNPDLSPEKTINYTLGVTKAFGKKITADLSGFYHDISDWISRDYYEDTFTGNEIYVNVEDVSMLGFETSVQVVFCDYFKMNLNYTYNDAENDSSKAVTEKVIGVPLHKLGAGFNMVIPRILASWDVQAIYVDEVYDSLPTTGSPDDEISESDNYFILNSRLSKTFKNKYEFYAEIDNLFDKDYREEVGFPAPGRNFLVGCGLEF